MKEKALFVEVDVQRDFIYHDGALTVNPAHINVCNMDFLTDAAPFLLGSVDSHDFTAWEFNTNNNKGPNGEDPQFPPHCVIGTPGWLRINQSRKNIQFIHQNQRDFVIDQNTDTLMLMKEVYSLGANRWAREAVAWSLLKNKYANTVVIYGVATEYCVQAAAKWFYENQVNKLRQWNIVVASDAIWGVTQVGHEKALQDMKEIGVKFLSTKEIWEKYETKAKKYSPVIDRIE